MTASRSNLHRQRLRSQGMRQLEVWLPEPMIEQIDHIKIETGEKRDAIIEKLLASTLGSKMAARREPELPATPTK